MQFYSILSTEADAGSGFVSLLPVFVLVVSIITLLLSFIVGFKKGAKRVSWAGIVWLATALIFFLLQGLLGGGIGESMRAYFKRVASNFGAVGDDRTNVINGLMTFMPAFIVACGCILVVTLVYGILSLKFRPKIKMIPKNADVYVLDEDGVEYDEDYEDYDDYECFTSRKMPMRINYETPGFGTRLIGGLLSLINAVAVLFTVIALGLFLTGATSLREGAFAALYENAIVTTIETFVLNYAMDVFFVGILIAFACKGRRNGCTETVRGLLKFVGLFLTLYSFYLPFSANAANPDRVLLYGLTTRCVGAMKGVFSSSLAGVANIIGKILAGLLLAAFMVAAFVTLNWVLRLLAEWTEKHKFTRIVDGIFAFVLYFVVGVLVCLAVWAVWYLLSRYGIFNVQELFTEKSPISSGLFQTFKGFIEPLLDEFDKVMGVA
ncbi:MAG: hypothetical protein E7355_02065 [Clostridiales bacterium]|nr:hypothetical protein [Clostridiales bacterium]